ncbi:hypothetical protein ED733_002583 [Metarhizium rileyi]|uniref:Uncharacterized protein n=1 Tax=Metarhizium rileyi (strain RCEF 4871) TaxID=1649241 RepID=A0A5C6G7Y3_METRR|nr:hypothetical protein ED733_002583 [Metarhizium rileyi]
MRDGSLEPTGSAIKRPAVEREVPLSGPAESESLLTPDEQAGEPTTWTPEQIRHSNGRWKEYLEKKHLPALWEKRPDTEQNRYRRVLDMLTADESRLGSQGSELLRQQQRWTSMQREPQEKQASLAMHQSELDQILRAGEVVSRHRSKQMQIEAEQEMWLQAVAQNPGRLYSSHAVRISDFEDVGAFEVKVARGLSNSRYYLGHKGGDYIFEYCRVGNKSGDESWLEDTAWDPNGPVWDHPSLHSFFGLEKGDAEFTDFKFRGLVPRSWREYAARFEIVCKEVLQALAALISFEPEGDGSLWGKGFEHVPAFNNINRLVVKHVCEAWDARVLPNHAYLCWIQSILNSDPRLCEFAYLIERLDALSRGMIGKGLAELIEVIETATSTALGELCIAYGKILEAEATRQLYDLRNVEHCVIYEDEEHEVEDIHKFYAQPDFNIDPDHPNNRFNHPYTESALEQAVTLWYLDLDWQNPSAISTLLQLRDKCSLPTTAKYIAKAIASKSDQTTLDSKQDSHDAQPGIAESQPIQQPGTTSTKRVSNATKRPADELQQGSDGLAPKRRRGRPCKHSGT